LQPKNGGIPEEMLPISLLFWLVPSHPFTLPATTNG